MSFVFRLYIAGPGRFSASALRTLLDMCNSYLPGRFRIEAIDICQQPERARKAQIVVAPTLVKVHPGPVQRVVGDLSDQSQILLGFGILQ